MRGQGGRIDGRVLRAASKNDAGNVVEEVGAGTGKRNITALGGKAFVGNNLVLDIVTGELAAGFAAKGVLACISHDARGEVRERAARTRREPLGARRRT